MGKALFFFFIIWGITPLLGQVNEGLVAKYSFNKGNATDETGDNDAKVVGATLSEDRFGNPRSAYYLHGNYGSYLNLGTSATLKPLKGSISLWFSIDNLVYSGKGVACNPIILTKCHNGNDFYEGYTLQYDIGSKKLGAATTLSEVNQVSSRSIKKIELRRWYHAVMTYDDDYLCLYLDGVLENKMAKNFRSRFLETDSVMIGNSANSKNHRFFNGYVDDIAIYDRVLTPEEVIQLYQAPNPNRSATIFKWIIMGVALAVFISLMIGLIKARIKVAIKKEKGKNLILNKSLEQEIKILKAQMNPHFVFNSLNVIQQFKFYT